MYSTCKTVMSRKGDEVEYYISGIYSECKTRFTDRVFVFIDNGWRALI